MGIKSKIKGSYAYHHWKLGKYTKRRVKTSVSPDWVVEHERESSYSNSNRNIEKYIPSTMKNYKNPVVKNNVVDHSDVNNERGEPKLPPRPVSTLVTNENNNLRRDKNGNPIRHSTIDFDKYNRVNLQKSDIDDVLVPTRSYTLVQNSNSSSVAYYSQNNVFNNNENYIQRNYSYTTNTYPTRPFYERKNI